MRECVRRFLPGLVVLLLLLLVYSGTLHRDLNSSDHQYMNDTGEIQVALNLWGTIHYTGYPVFTVLGASLTHLLRATSLSPAAAASAVSTIWSLLGLGTTYWLIAHLSEGDYAIASLVVLVLGLMETFWVHSVVAEVYSFSLLLTSVVLLLAIQLAQAWHWRYWWLMIGCLGLSTQHHRLLLLLVPSALLITFPMVRKNLSDWLRHGVGSVFVFLLPFLAYLYLPLRALQGAEWVYGQPGTWTGFWNQFFGREATRRVLEWPSNASMWLDNFHFLMAQLQNQLPLVLILLGIAGLIGLARERSLWTGLGLLVGSGGFALFVLLFPSAVLAHATLMPTLMLVMGGLSYLLHRLAYVSPFLRVGLLAGLVMLAGWLFCTNLPFVQALQQGHGDVIQTLRPLNTVDLPGGRDVMALPWGKDYFSAAYGLYVTGELEDFDLVDHRANLRSIVQEEDKVITLAYNLARWPLYWWQGLLGEAHYNSAAPGVAMVSRDLLYQDVPARLDFDLGNGVSVRDIRLLKREKNKLYVTIYWESQSQLHLDYRVAVHLVANDPPAGAQDILAQADSPHPVGGWYPTTLWTAGDVVRDDYLLTIPPEASPVAIRVAMYRLNEDGSFNNTAWVSHPISTNSEGAIKKQPTADWWPIEPQQEMRIEAIYST